MGTRGIYGFRKGGVDKLTYNHFDSYPSGLGAGILEFVRETSVDKLNEIFDRIQMVDGNTKATAEQIEECEKYFDDRVSTGDKAEWYCLLRRVQGDLRAYKKGLKYMIDDKEFLYDSLFCEYGYIINLDTNELEFWNGFQRRPQKGNRYGDEKDGAYYPCALLSTYKLNDINGVDDEYLRNLVGHMEMNSELDYKDQDEKVPR